MSFEKLPLSETCEALLLAKLELWAPCGVHVKSKDYKDDLTGDDFLWFLEMMSNPFPSDC